VEGYLQGKTEELVEEPVPLTLCPTWTDLGANPCLSGDRLATNRLNHGTAPRIKLVSDNRSSRVSSSSIVSYYGLDYPGDWGSIPDSGKEFFLRPLCLDRLWGLPRFLFNGVPWVLSPGVKHGRGVTLTTHPHLVKRS
jgi:hypothetical protein